MLLPDCNLTYIRHLRANHKQVNQKCYLINSGHVMLTNGTNERHQLIETNVARLEDKVTWRSVSILTIIAFIIIYFIFYIFKKFIVFYYCYFLLIF